MSAPQAAPVADLILLQMGKVASTAIASALEQGGIRTLQAHHAAPSRLAEKLNAIASPALDEEMAARVYQDYLFELQVMYQVSRARVRGRAGEGTLLPLITPVRDPLTWYWSHFAQMYDHYRNLLERYHLAGGGARETFDAESVFLEVQERMFALLNASPLALDDPASFPALRKAANEIDDTNVIAAQVNRFLVPLRWFDEDFRAATGINVYRHAFDSAHGVTEISDGGFRVLLLQYEKLAALGPEIARFAGLPGLALDRENTSEDKDVPFDIAKMRREGLQRMPPGLAERLYGYRYARHFGYEPASD